MILKKGVNQFTFQVRLKAKTTSIYGEIIGVHKLVGTEETNEGDITITNVVLRELSKAN